MNRVKDKALEIIQIRYILIIFIFLTTLILNLFFIKIVIVKGTSMIPSLRDGELLVVKRHTKELKHGDIALIRISTPERGLGYIIKRVIAVGGETVKIDYTENKVYVNDVIIEEPYINRNHPDPMIPTDNQVIFEYKIPEKHVFVMGDNRNHSSDSRDPMIGNISIYEVAGIVVIN